MHTIHKVIFLAIYAVYIPTEALRTKKHLRVQFLREQAEFTQ